MYTIPCMKPLDNLEACYLTMKEILKYKKNNWAIGQLYPNGGPDEFTYFFSIRNIPIANYLRGNISMGEPTAYDVNIKALYQYMQWQIDEELCNIRDEIALIHEYRNKNWSIGEAYPDGGPDQFVVFFAQRGLPIVPYLRGTVDIGEPTAYCENIGILKEYRLEILAFDFDFSL